MKHLRALTVVIVLLLSLVLGGCQKAQEVPEETQPLKQGLIAENGGLYYYNEDGTMFTGGYKEITDGGETAYYYFTDTGRAFTKGHKVVAIGQESFIFFFEEDGKAFTGGLKEVPFGSGLYTYCFAEDGKALTACWETIDGIRYYFQDNGQAARGMFLTVEDSLYYFDKTAAPVAGCWFCLDAEQAWFYADENGALAADTVFEGYRFDSNGKCTTKYRIRELVASVVQDTMTDQEKIEALYNWVLSSDMSYRRTYEHVSAGWKWKEGWVDDMAADLMDNQSGNCCRYAAFMGLLISEATDLQVSVALGDSKATTGGRTPHSWVNVWHEDGWYIYDVELQKFAHVDQERCYRVPEGESDLHFDGKPTALYSE